MKVRYHKKFIRNLRLSDVNIQSAFRERFEIFCDNPYDPRLNNHALRGKWQDCRSINITGNFRAVYDQVAEDEVMFVDFGTHGQLYG